MMSEQKKQDFGVKMVIDQTELALDYHMRMKQMAGAMCSLMQEAQAAGLNIGLNIAPDQNGRFQPHVTVNKTFVSS